jgi:tellurite resistance protein TerC
MASGLFPIAEYWHIYASLSLMVVALVLVDLGLFHKSAKERTLKDSALWTMLWVGLAIAFGAFMSYYLSQRGDVPPDAVRKAVLEFFSCYLLEWSLSIDNVFAFLLVFQFFRIGPKFHSRILFLGICGAVVFRAIFIAAGAYLLRFQAALIVFGAIILVSGLKMMFIQDADDQDGPPRWMLKLQNWVRFDPNAEGDHFFVVHDGKRWATRAFLALLAIEMSDLVFAVDSVPAAFGITTDPFLIFSSNVLAILGLRSLFFVLSHMARAFHLLRYGVAVVLVLIGIKMTIVAPVFKYHLPPGWWFAIIATCLGASIALSSFYKPPRDIELIRPAEDESGDPV